MRIIAGSLKGRKLKGFKGDAIRPTSDRARETLFNIIGSSIEGASFLDLFAGSGAVGIEAISRGASQVVFVDSSPASVKLILLNTNICGIELADRLSSEAIFLLIKKDARKAITELAGGKKTFDFIFLDPPYQKELYLPVLKLIRETSILNSSGWIIAEHDSKKTLTLPEIYLKLLRRVKVGDTSFSIFLKESME